MVTLQEAIGNERDGEQQRTTTVRTMPEARLFREERQHMGPDMPMVQPSTPAPEVEEPLVEPVPPEPTPEPVSPESVAEPEPEPTGALTVHLTFYVCAGAPPGQSYCGTMASGATVYEGAAACGYALDLGDRFLIVGDPTGRTYICEDRGAGPYHWIDVFHYDYSSGRTWRSNFGQDVVIEIVG